MDLSISGIGPLILLIVGVGIFAALRAFMLWYWKINDIETYQKRLIELAEKQLVATEVTNRMLQRIQDSDEPAAPQPEQRRPPPQFPPARTNQQMRKWPE